MAHYLTFENFISGITIKVNGTAVSSGYQLQNGDIITVDTDGDVYYCDVNNTRYTPTNTGNINISNQDIYIGTGYWGGGN